MTKNRLLGLLLMGIISIGNAQEVETKVPASERKHEFRIDVLEGLAIPSIDISYEYVISKYSGVGISTYFNISGDDFEYDQDFVITPYYRQYFFNKKDYGARGLFAEGLIQFGTGDDTYGDSPFFEEGYGPESDGTWSAFGIGVAIGQKWVSKNGFILEISFGGGRYFGSEYGAPEGFLRGGISFGYRFF